MPIKKSERGPGVITNFIFLSLKNLFEIRFEYTYLKYHEKIAPLGIKGGKVWKLDLRMKTVETGEK